MARIHLFFQQTNAHLSDAFDSFLIFKTIARFCFILMLTCGLAFSIVFVEAAKSTEEDVGVSMMVSTDQHGVQGDYASYNLDDGGGNSISEDGRYVVFESVATNLITGTTGRQIFRKDITNQEIRLVSANADGVKANDNSYLPAISADGRYVAFHSWALNLVDGSKCELLNEIGPNGKPNTCPQVYVKDMADGRIILASKSASGVPGQNGRSFYQSISPDGKYVSFTSDADNLVPGDTVGGMDPGENPDKWACTGDPIPGDTCRDIFVKEIKFVGTEGKIVRIGADAAGGEPNYNSFDPDISSDVQHDGTYSVAFESAAWNLTSDDYFCGLTGDRPTYCSDIFVGKIQTSAPPEEPSQIIRVTGTAGQEVAYNYRPSITPDGRFVSFGSNSNMLAGESNSVFDIFVKEIKWDGSSGRIVLASQSSDDSQGDSVQGNANSLVPSISENGNYVSFMSGASNLVPGDTNNQRDIFVKQIIWDGESNGEIRRVSIHPTTENPSGNAATHSYRPAMSADGMRVSFWSDADNLYENDLNGVYDVFLAQTGFASDLDKLAPEVTNIQPNGPITTSPTVITAELSDELSGINVTTVKVNLDGNPLPGCLVTNDSVSCGLAELNQGPHSIDITVADNRGNVRASTGIFEVIGRSQTITINAQGGDCEQIGQWNASTKTCTLNGDHHIGPVDGITIIDDGVTLDGGGHKLIGNGGNSGVLTEGMKDIKIRNLVVEGFSLGIYFYNVGNGGVMNNSHVEENTLSGNGFGIFVSNSANILVRGNTSSGNSNAGIGGWALNQSEIRGNTVSGNPEGLHLYNNSSSNSIYGNSFLNNTTQARVEGGSGNVFSLAMPVGGNYWSNFDSQEEGCADSYSPSGVCDSAYVIRPSGIPLVDPPSVQDNLPWTSVAPDSPSFKIIVKESHSSYEGLNKYLSVTYEAYNRGPQAHDVNVLEPWVSNPGVTRISALPEGLNVDRTEKFAFVIKYQVPVGALSFQNRITITHTGADGVSGESTMETTSINT